jgi:hypothetical protein
MSEAGPSQGPVEDQQTEAAKTRPHPVAFRFPKEEDNNLSKKKLKSTTIPAKPMDAAGFHYLAQNNPVSKAKAALRKDKPTPFSETVKVCTERWKN